MITCTVCGEQNEDLAGICRSCKSFLQAKVDALDLFATVGSLLESPRPTFKRIVLARTKNYVILLGALLGVFLVYSAIWYRAWGSAFSSIATIVGAGLIGGPLVGVLFLLFLAMVSLVVARLLGGRGGYRNTFAVLAYAHVPVVLALCFVFPVELAIFGRYLFDANPSPMVISPVLYLALLGFDAAAVVWTGALMIQGLAVAHTTTRARMVVVVALLAGIVVLIGFGLRMV